MNVLVDTSVWVGHFKQRNERLVALLEAGVVICHPYVVVEVACGTPPSRRAITAMLGELCSSPVATMDEVLEMIERRNLYGRGCGFVDMSLLAATLLGEQAMIWTLDKRLDSIAGELNRAYRPALHS
ncbi:MAG: PIN domain-containing protein [Gammaproteobacteria bacterium]|uniref:type II toxin-antitoxin system VapC family toxin n=1 Tax=Rhodoferax sp. TaxID=50421 RepID=UPI00185E3191|nr:PIN domain-containing protein [Rhodoferax sp.]MBU3898925.1 PIN domain-containing protein [Gammaproteobacteria bacterium]MBA3059272.1 PIN domain-containing protein [Rhodoferax sp.]MBU3997526.1 PIN domain-containing protein [Gammaproteobacteria bacterium]MBU4018368.1 PIN domain-containing protein [Gammaproteobacteria bacterium]MBU4080381.1 PIN domain-containing protein [Gammaproteobacteria bacterium]